MAFSYKSSEVRTFLEKKGSKNGNRGNRGMTRKGMTRRNNVIINGNKGSKSVSILDINGKELFQKTLPLTKKELACIRRRKFIPGLFNNCIEEINATNAMNSMRKNHRKTRRLRK